MSLRVYGVYKVKAVYRVNESTGSMVYKVNVVYRVDESTGL